MSEKIKVFVIIFVAILWFAIFGFLGFSIAHPLQWMALVALGVLTLFIFGLLFQTLKLQNTFVDKNRFHNALGSTLAQNGEYIIFDEGGKTIYTTHPHIYPNKKEFLRKIMLRTEPSNDTAQLSRLIEEHQKGEVILTGGGNGLGQSQKRWLVRVIPVDPLLVRGKHYLMVMCFEMTRYLETLSNLKSQNKTLEAFIDDAPFAIFYANATKTFVGANSTLSSWLNIEKDKLAGHPIKDFIEDYDHRIMDDKIRVVTLKPHKKNQFKALWFPPSQSKTKAHASIICKIDDNSLIKRAEKDDHLSQQTFNNARIASVILDVEGKILSFNESFSEMVSGAQEIENLQVGQDFFTFIAPESKDELLEKTLKSCETKEQPGLLEVLFKDDTIHTTAYGSLVEQSLDPNVPAQMMLQFIDISEQKRLEQQFIQSQKMQAVGQLAGGIAHDFNNLLTAMIGFCDLLLQRYMPNDPSYTDIIQIKQNANRAANLVRQLLAFSRQQTLQLRVMNITDVLSELNSLLRRLIGARIDLKINHGRNLWPVRADMSQFEQVIINLAVNARDAMADGGALTIKTSNFQTPQPMQLGHDILPRGDYAVIEVIDTGHGIPDDVIEHIFEPFFSTKEVGAGTGLGLSTVYGIIKQTGGFIKAESTVDKGTTFKVFLPRFHGEEKKPETIEQAPAVSDLSGQGRILLVEDEDAVRMFSARALRDKGYIVSEAESGESALKLIDAGETFDLLLTDVVMPKMDGPTLNKKVLDLMPGIKTIFISGYTEDTFRKNVGADVQIHFLAKPFSLKDLAEKVKSVLNR